ncbi:acetobutylicum phosphotransbutyrylase [Halalkalibacter wakoensis JCM 9140]|uniref:Acetobutylicum phosphotransbutyrylase n=1 Tax=Halalkalibacter wakoensis JCM 9140 TaxID=1236970 RepID=W4Q842_9BACI|nr:VanZ family protein [Halalkalibacter wakoensis]GAE28157.1 acetobutylicum phosphotransbutyrylase [Halalkalibacter wakoensis JCM 9140]
MKNTKIWWGVSIVWCLGIAVATQQPFFTGDSTEQLLTNPFIDSAFLNYIVRKSVHLSAFGLLALFLWLALRNHKRRYLLAWIFATLYGAIDEWHQSFIQNVRAYSLMF